jgi:hypothetical protein
MYILAAGFVYWMCLNLALYKLVIVISTHFERMTPSFLKNSGGVRNAILYWLASLLQMDLLAYCSRAAQRRAGRNVSQWVCTEVLWVFWSLWWVCVFRFNVCGSVCIGNVCFTQIQPHVQYSFSLEKFLALHVSDDTCVNRQEHNWSVWP